MARIDNLTNFLTDIATAIRQKKETEAEIPAEQFDSEILSIETGIDTSDATATSNDIISPKTAYVNGIKVKGNILCNSAPTDGQVITDEYAFTSNTDYRSSVAFTPDKEYALCMDANKIYGYKKVNGNYVLKTTFTNINAGDNPYNAFSGNIILAKMPIDGTTDTYYGVYFYKKDLIVPFKVVFRDDIVITNLRSYSDYTGPLYSMDFANNAYDIVAIAAPMSSGKLSIKTMKITDTGMQMISDETFEGGGWATPALIRFSPDDKHLVCHKTTNSNLLSKPIISLYRTSSNYTITKMTVATNIKYISLDCSCAINTSNELCKLVFTDTNANLSDKLYNNIENAYIPVNEKLLTSITNSGELITSITFINIADTTNVIRTQITVYRGLFDVLRTFSIFRHDSSDFKSAYFDTSAERLENINKQGVVLFNTDNADVASSDVITGKVAYGPNGKITGTLPMIPNGSDYELPLGSINKDDTASTLDLVFIPTEKRAFQANSWLNSKLPYEQVANCAGLTSDILRTGTSVLGINGTANFTLEGVVSYQDEASLLADTTQKTNTIGLVQTYIPGDWVFDVPSVYRWTGMEWKKYGESGPISQEEYDQALDTANEIKGGIE